MGGSARRVGPPSENNHQPSKSYSLQVLDRLPLRHRLRAAFTCTRWLHLLSAQLSAVTELHILLDASCCRPRVHLSNSGANHLHLSIAVCQCKRAHIGAHCDMLATIVTRIGGSLRSLIIDDCFIGGCDAIADATLFAILDACQQPANVVSLQLINVDLSRVRAWTFALFGRFHRLHDLVLDQCDHIRWSFGNVLIASSQSLTHINITHSPIVTDWLLDRIAHDCIFICRLDVSNCRQLTSASIRVFCATSTHRRAHLLTMVMRATAISDADDVRRCVDDGWEVNQVQLEIGHRQVALYVHKTGANAIMLFI